MNKASNKRAAKEYWLKLNETERKSLDVVLKHDKKLKTAPRESLIQKLIDVKHKEESREKTDKFYIEKAQNHYNGLGITVPENTTVDPKTHACHVMAWVAIPYPICEDCDEYVDVTEAKNIGDDMMVCKECYKKRHLTANDLAEAISKTLVQFGPGTAAGVTNDGTGSLDAEFARQKQRFKISIEEVTDSKEEKPITTSKKAATRSKAVADLFDHKKLVAHYAKQDLVDEHPLYITLAEVFAVDRNVSCSIIADLEDYFSAEELNQIRAIFYVNLNPEEAKEGCTGSA